MRKELAEEMLKAIEELNAEIASKQEELDNLVEQYQQLTGDVEVFEETNEEIVEE